VCSSDLLHNFAYIGTGKDFSNDSTLVIQGNEVVKLNNGKIYYQSHNKGKLRIGDAFFVDLERGTTSVDLSTLTTNSLSGLVINTGTDTTTITGSKLETGNIRVSGNLIQSLAGDLNVVGATNEINLLDNTNINADLDIVGNFSFDGTLNLAGNEVTDGLRFNVEFEQDFNPNQHLTFSLGTPSKQWLAAYLNRLEVGDVSIYDNVIETNVTNSDLELRANGSGLIYIPDSATFSNALTVTGVSELDNVVIQGNFNLTGVLTQTGNINISNNLAVSQNITVGAAAQFEEILIDGNVITTTNSNSNLELRASGTGVITIQEVTDLRQNLSANNISAQSDINITLNLSTDNATIGNIEFNDNYIQTTGLNQSLTLLSAQNVTVTSNDVTLNQTLTVNGDTDTQSATVTGLIDHTGNRNQTGNYNIAGEFTNGDILIKDNFITSAPLDSDLELRANGTGTILVPNNNVIITNDLSVDGVTDIQSVSIIGTLTHTGDRNQTGDYSQTGNLDITGTISIDSLAQFTDVSINGNTLTTTLTNNNLILNADGNGLVIVQSNLDVSNDLSARSITVLGDIVIDQDLNLENISVPPSIIDIGDNYISTKVSNADLELRANGTGSVVIDLNNVVINNNLTVIRDTDLQDLTVTGTIAHVGNQTQIGEYNQTGNLTIDGSATITDTAILDDIEIDQNILRSISGDLVLTANGAGLVTFSSLLVEQNLTAGTLTAGDIIINNTLALEMLESSTDIQIFDNVITTTNSNSNLELRTNGAGDISLQDLKFNGSRIRTSSANITIDANNTVIVSATGALIVPVGTTAQRTNILGDIRFNTTDSVFEAKGQTNTITFNGVYSSDRRTNVLAHPTNNTLLFAVNQTLVGTIAASGLTIHEIQIDDILLDANRIATTVSNSNLELRSDGTGELVIDNLSIKDNFIKTASTPIVIASTSFGYTKLETTIGAVFPTGTTSERPAPETPPQTGDTRFNTTDEVLEVWDGSTYIIAAGTSSTISESEFNDLVLEYTLILG
jgi:cytoskeletal protein CcmA (bactofilin family)